ncbi:MAG TPA: M20/M25/M40 family metallo-hydrolase [Candidatus Acidoferrales bacterium]|nr:M20/M25/M40 family metallo-hydrolase [Candidatus Acidoferrales bacterium]
MLNAPSSRLLGIALFLLPFSIFCPRLASGQRTTKAAQSQSESGTWPEILRDFVDTPAVSGYENQLAGRIRAHITSFHPVTDSLGDIIVTLGNGAPHRLIVTPIDEPGFVVSGITDDGYLRLQRLPQSGLPPILNELYSAQPVKVGVADGKWIDGVVASLSIHLQPGRVNPPKSSDIDNMYVDIGASSAAEARKAGVDILSPVAIDRRLEGLGGNEMAGASAGDKFGAAALVELLHEIDPANVKGTLTIAFAAQQWAGARGLQRVLRTTRPDEMIYVGRLVPGGAVPGMKGVHRAPRREPGSGVLLGLAQTNDELSGLPSQLKQLAAANSVPIATDYSAGLIPSSYLPLPDLPTKWAHLAIATAWSDTPAETIDAKDLGALEDLLQLYAQGKVALPQQAIAGRSAPQGNHEEISGVPATTELLSRLTTTYGASNHEQPVREMIKGLLPKWAKPETDDAGNLILHLGSAPAAVQTPKILVIAHMDEIGFEVKSISNDGRLEADLLGGMILSFYQGHPALVHTSTGDLEAIIELPNGWDEATFEWPNDSENPIRIDVGARTPEEAAKLGVKVGDSITVPKEYHSLLGTRANARSFDDRVGDAALISAVWSLGRSLHDRDVTFVWSTGEELGLDGAAALAKRLAAEGHEPDYVFAVDTLVSSDSPLESKRFADAQIGKGFAIRAVDNSNIAPAPLVDRLLHLARANRVPVQLAVTGGGNDGSAFVPYGAVDIALGWPLRYSHSPGEVIDTRDVDALARIVAVIATSW